MKKLTLLIILIALQCQLFSQTDTLVSYNVRTKEIKIVNSNPVIEDKNFDFTQWNYGSESGFIFLPTEEPNNTYNNSGFTDYYPVQYLFTVDKYPIRTAVKLFRLEDKHKKLMTPLLELVMPKINPYKDKAKKIRKTDEEIFNETLSNFKYVQLPEIPIKILKSWGFKPIYIDFSLLYTIHLRKESIQKISSLGKQIGLHLILVINLNDDEEIFKTVCSLKEVNGICLRIVPSDFSSIEVLNERIKSFLKLVGLSETKIDLLIDLKDITELDGIYQKYIGLSQRINNLSQWRNFIFASGAFPEDMSKCNIDDLNLAPRYDWLNWNKQIKNGNLKRNPIFADYTIRHPIYDESLQHFPPTTSIKYTIDNDWLIMKGKKLKFELYLANAKILYSDTNYYYGEDFSFGDKYLAEKGRHFDKYIKDPKIKGTGSTETWLSACINHHLVCTVSQIANLI